MRIQVASWTVPAFVLAKVFVAAPFAILMGIVLLSVIRIVYVALAIIIIYGLAGFCVLTWVSAFDSGIRAAPMSLVVLYAIPDAVVLTAIGYVIALLLVRMKVLHLIPISIEACQNCGYSPPFFRQSCPECGCDPRRCAVRSTAYGFLVAAISWLSVTFVLNIVLRTLDR